MTKNLQNPELHPKYRPDIDGLRAVAVLAVIVFHAFPNWVKGGFIGVDIFFVISGFLISTILFENLDRGSFGFYEFYARRIKRIFPALILVLSACFIFGWFILNADEFRQLGKHIAGGSGFISNIIFWREAGYFDNAGETKPLLHLWSLGIEEQFYIFWPILLCFCWKRSFNLLIITIIVASASFILNLNGVKHDIVATFYSPQSRFWELLSGSILAWLALYKQRLFLNYKKEIQIWFTKNFHIGRPEADEFFFDSTLSIIGAIFLLTGFWLINKDAHFPGALATVPVLGALFMIAAGPKAYVNRTILSNKIVTWFGLISFPLYLWHWPLLSFARIVEDKSPSLSMRIYIIILSIILAWFTYRFVERPIRLSRHSWIKVGALIFLMLIVGYVGYNTYSRDGLEFRKAHKKAVAENINRLAWYQGKGDWLFLGNAYSHCVAKLTLSITPAKEEVEATHEIFSQIAKAGEKYNTKIVLIMGPDKSSVYSEYLPDDIAPSKLKYSSFFLESLREIPNLTVYDPTENLINLKKTQGILYWMTDSHWNNKGAFFAYLGFLKLFGLPEPQIEFQQGSVHSGDLINISRLKNFPLHREDSWDVIWKNKPSWTEKEIPNEQKTPFGSSTVVENHIPLSDQYIWVVGDSFSGALRQFFNATFKQVRYVGQWSDKLKDLPADLVATGKKPDMIVIVRVERSF
jgi:peptidoglycan/LPS O-acetylase OafA/YrhL